jgi:hypothetical protein
MELSHGVADLMRALEYVLARDWQWLIDNSGIRVGKA